MLAPPCFNADPKQRKIFLCDCYDHLYLPVLFSFVSLFYTHSATKKKLFRVFLLTNSSLSFNKNVIVYFKLWKRAYVLV